MVRLCGRLENGDTFLIRDDRQTPHFFVRADALAAAEPSDWRGAWLSPSDERGFQGEATRRVSVPIPADAPPVRDRLHARGIDTFEADVRFAVRYLIDRGIKGGCQIRGRPRPGQAAAAPRSSGAAGDAARAPPAGAPAASQRPEPISGTSSTAASQPISGFESDRDVAHGGMQSSTAVNPPVSGFRWIFDNPALHPADADFHPSALAFDIETDAKAHRLLAISLFGCGADEVHIVDPKRRPMPERAFACASEREALDAFCRRVCELDPDVLTGWNLIDFDLTVLARIAARLRHPFNLGRTPGQLRIRPAQGYFGSGSASLPGRLVLDGVDLLRGAFMRMEDYSLDAVAKTVLGEGKALAGDSRDRVGEILRNYASDLDAFALYARTDARLALAIVERLNLLNLAVARSRLTGMTPDRVAASIASFDFLYLAELRKRKIRAPTVRSDNARVHEAQAGGHVLEPVTGLHREVWVFDFKSLYPSIIRTYNIDPLGFIDRSQEARDPIALATGARFSRAPAILPGLLDQLFPRREQAKRDGDAVASQAIKILMNSFYGVLGTPACRFYNPEIANAITGQGRHLLLWSKRWFEERGFRVLYGDTDSLFVASGLDAEAARARGPELAAALSQDLAAWIRQEARVTSRLELELEKLYRKLFLPAVRSGAGGARKRYAGLVHGRDEVEFVGMETVRRDWTELAKQVQRELYLRLFREEPVQDWLRTLVARLRAGELDDWLIYRKGLRKEVSAYRASTPPHVAAARKSKAPAGRVVAYLVTRAGPEPLDNLTAEPDREHYLAKQVRPVAEPVLATLGLDFDQAIGDDQQEALF